MKAFRNGKKVGWGERRGRVDFSSEDECMNGTILSLAYKLGLQITNLLYHL